MSQEMSETPQVWTRRAFLQLCSLGLLGVALDPFDFFTALAAGPLPTLILVELKGGNDGLNTVIPYADPNYARLRPRLAIPRAQILQLNPSLGLHPALEALWPAWKAQELAWVLGVGYPQPNRSHFRSIQIWDSASGAQDYLESGWLAQVLPAWRGRQQALVDGIYFGRGTAGPLAGLPRSLAAGQARLSRHIDRVDAPATEALLHILRVQSSLQRAESGLLHYRQKAVNLQKYFPRTAFGRQLAELTSLMLAGAPVPVYRVTLGSFDTHRQQLRTHARLLQQLAEGLAALRKVLSAQGQWDRTLVMSYSEFGRRPRENASGGSDHGTAAPHLVLGGRVKGGLYGQQPALNQLRNDDLQHTVDFRSLYQTVAQKWWGIDRRWAGSAFHSLKFL